MSHTFFIATTGRDSGNGRRFRALAAALRRRGHSVVLWIDPQGQAQNEVAPDPDLIEYTWRGRQPNTPRNLLFLIRRMRQHQPDCVIGSFMSVNILMFAGMLVGVRARLAWHRTLSTQQTADLEMPIWKLRLNQMRKRWFFRMATTVLTLSDAGEHDLKAVFGVPVGKIRIFTNGLDDPLDLPEVQAAAEREQIGAARIVCVGRLHRSKGQDVLLRALAILHDEPDTPRFHAVFVGDGSCRGECETLTESLGLQHRVIFTGAVHRADALKWLASSAISVVPSRHEALGNVNIESMAVGTALVASAVDGIVEIVRDGDTGLLVPPEDPPALADALRRLLCDLELRERIGRQGRAHYLVQFALHHQISLQADWLESILD